MRIRYRIVELNSGRFAIEKKLSLLGLSPFGWEFVYIQHPDYPAMVETFDTVEDARKYFINPMDVKRVVENIRHE